MFVSLFIGLFSTRIVLIALGVDEYGLFNIVAGVIGVLGIVNTAMVSTTQRFISFVKGSNDQTKLKHYFGSSLFIHFMLGLFVFIILVAVGPYLINNFLVIPIDKLSDALYLYYFVTASATVAIMVTPYDGCILANEDFSFIAITELFKSSSRLISALIVSFYFSNKLLMFGLLISSSNIIIEFSKLVFSIKNYNESQFSISTIRRSIVLEMVSFAAWNLFASVTSLAKHQGVNILINLFFGVAANAALAISKQIVGLIGSFVSVITRSVNPQLTQAEGGGKRERMLQLSGLMTKLSFIVLVLLTGPIIFEAKFLLSIWLKDVPHNSDLLVIAAVLGLLTVSLSTGLEAAVFAIGKIRTYQLVAGIITVSSILFTYFLFKLNFPSYYAYISIMFSQLLLHVFQLFFLSRTANLTVKNYIYNVDFSLLKLLGISLAISYIITLVFDQGFFRLLIVSCSNTAFVLISSYLIVLDKNEKETAKKIVIQIKGKLFKSHRTY